jgi:hypothetical protein
VTLGNDPKWVLISADQFAVVHVRKSVWDAVKAGRGRQGRARAVLVEEDAVPI